MTESERERHQQDFSRISSAELRAVVLACRLRPDAAELMQIAQAELLKREHAEKR